MANDRKVLGITLTAEGTQEVEAAFRSLGTEGEAAAKRIRSSFEAINFKGDLTGTVRKELDSLGQAGEEAAKKINSALEKVGIGETVTARIVRLKKSLVDLANTTKLTQSGFSNIRSGADRMVAGIDRSVKVIGALSLAIGGAVTAATLLAKSSADTAEQIQNQATAFGISFENMQRLRGAINAVGGDEGLLERALTKFTAGLNGTNDAAESASDALNKLRKEQADQITNATTQAQADSINAKFRDRIADATKKLEKAQAVFNDTQQSGLPGLIEYAQRLRALGNSQVQLAQVTKDFGAKGAVTTLAFLQQLSDEFDTAAQAANRMLPPLDALGQASLAQLDGAGDKLATNFSRLALLVGSRIAPAFTAIYDIVREIIGTVGPALADALGGVATAIANQITRNKDAVIAFAKDVTASAIVLARDIANALNGVNSRDTSNWIITLKNDVVGAFKFIRDTVSNVLVPAFRGLSTVLEPVAGLLNSVFGTEFTGNALAAVVVLAQFSGGMKILSGATEIAWGSMKILFDWTVNGKAKVLALVDAITKFYQLAKAASTALITLIAANPELAIAALAVAGLVAGIAYLATRETEAEAAARAHGEAMDALNTAYAAVEAGVAGATDAWEKEKQKQLESANAALANADAHVAAIQNEIDSMVAMQQSLGVVGDALDRWSKVTIQFNIDQLNKAKSAQSAYAANVSSIKARIIELENPNKKLAAATNQIAANMRQASAAADGLQAGYRRITLSGPDGFKKVFEVPSQELLDAQTKARQLKQELATPGENGLLTEAQAKAENFIATISQLGDIIQQALINVSANASEQIQALVDAIPAFFDNIGQAINLKGIADAFVALTDNVKAIFASAGADLANTWAANMAAITNSTASMAQSVGALIDRLTATLDKLRSSIASARAASGSTGGGGGYAGGGYISGPGTGTSDSIPAWLSNGEYVLRSAAVNRLPLSFLNALNSGRFDLADLLRRFMNSQMRFAAGGMVRLPKLSLSGLSAASAGGPMSSVTLVIGGDSFGGLTGPADTISRLERAIKAKRVRSTGRVSPYER